MSDSTVSQPSQQTEEKPKLKICCACPETKKKRDECVIMNGEDNCKNLIEDHLVCLRKAGFKV